MTVRSTSFTTIVAALILASLVAVIGAAQAAPATKTYSATVHVSAGEVDIESGRATLTLTLKNESKNTLGSAQFTPRDGVTVDPASIDGTTTDADWTASYDEGSVMLLSTAPLIKGEWVSTDVEVSFAGCADATWDTRAKQSNDFSGTPGNDFNLNMSLSNLLPLGSFTIADIGTLADDPETLEDEMLFVPQIRVFDADEPVVTTTQVDITAKDLCGDEYLDYDDGVGNDATLVAKPDTPPRLEGTGVISTIDWTDGTADGSATLKPVDVETGDQLIVADVRTEVDAESTVFDVVQKLCTQFDDSCEWKNQNESITANAPGPPEEPGKDGDPASLGIGFASQAADLQELDFSCNGDTTLRGNTLININPRDYPTSEPTITVTLTYKKSETGNGPASSFDICLLTDYGEDWTNVGPCGSPAVAPCFLDRKRITGGDLQVVLFLLSEDPWGGLS